MRLSLHVIGLTAALLFGAHIDAYLDPVSQQDYVRASTETTEAVTLTDLNHYQLKLVGCNYRLEVSDYSKEILERLFDWKESV